MNCGFRNSPPPPSRTPPSSLGTTPLTCSNPGFGNSMFEPWVRELYVRTLGPLPGPPPPLWGPPPSNVRTLGSGTLCSNPAFGNSMFEPLGTLDSGTLCSNPGLNLGFQEFEPWVQPKLESYMFPPPPPPPPTPPPGVRTQGSNTLQKPMLSQEWGGT